MALARAVQGAIRTGQTITVTYEGTTTAYPITGTLSGRMRNKATGIEQVITGALAATTPGGSSFSWAYSAADVATAGIFDAQFKADYGASGYDLSITEDFEVLEAV